MQREKQVASKQEFELNSISLFYCEAYFFKFSITFQGSHPVLIEDDSGGKPGHEYWHHQNKYIAKQRIVIVKSF